MAGVGERGGGGEGVGWTWQERNVFHLSRPGLPAVYSILLYCKPINNTGQDGAGDSRGR